MLYAACLSVFANQDSQMQYRALNRILRGSLLALFAALLLSACGGKTRPDAVAAPNIPASFDITLLPEKDGQFDLNGATLSEEDVKGHLRYLRDQNKPAQSVFLKREGKQKVTDRHVQGLARIGFELKVHTFLQEKPGAEITEIRVESAAK
ncbi:MAG: hypothetical protein BGP24_16885 [Lysobacterales bacterium 69-70]|nr:MAG: hypothetical protein ABS97_11245 [Xanthomonadaceae bacterium SCN 69-320]ODV21997.1 MAG: hypothetical protein ABT27_03630 [Xanthomonadaceae bacterium SCN 69-25]OJZ02900.1 MAG: hypothetical protein BGP24_16885 [Xanthomonadales bacterium 69-70]